MMGDQAVQKVPVRPGRKGDQEIVLLPGPTSEESALPGNRHSVSGPASGEVVVEAIDSVISLSVSLFIFLRNCQGVLRRFVMLGAETKKAPFGNVNLLPAVDFALVDDHRLALLRSPDAATHHRDHWI